MHKKKSHRRNAVVFLFIGSLSGDCQIVIRKKDSRNIQKRHQVPYLQFCIQFKQFEPTRI